MSNLIARLAKAKSRLFGTAAKEIPVPFDLPCDCGHRVAGIRRPTYQLAICSECSEALYVLPVNVYPTNRRVRSEVIEGPLVAKVGTVVRDLLGGDKTADDASSKPSSAAASAESDSSGKAAPTGRKVKRKRRRSKAEPDDVTPPAATITVIDGEAVVQLPRLSLGTRLRRSVTPTRVLAIAGLTILLSTGWWMMRQRKMDQARKEWRSEMDRAEEALGKRDLRTLGESLTAAIKAARQLDRSDADVRQAESLLRQTEAVQQLSSLDLVDQLSGATRQDGRLNAEKAAAACSSLADQQVVFEACVKPAYSASEPARLDFPLVVDGIPVEIHVASPLLVRCSHESPTMPLLFAARIKDGRPPSDAQPYWLINLWPTSCTLITTEFHASQLGFESRSDEAIRETVERQAEFMRSLNDVLTPQEDESGKVEKEKER